MKKVTIPRCAHPFVVAVNGRKYSYPAGTEQEVPDAVAAIIERHNESHNDYGCGAVEKTEFAIGYGEGYADGHSTGISYLKDLIENAGTITECSNSYITKIGECAFAYWNELEAVNFPNVTKLCHWAFLECGSLTDVVLPKLERIEGSPFDECSNIKVLDFSSVIRFGPNALEYAYSLKALVLRNEQQVCQLDGNRALVETQIDYGEGYIYVPRALLDSYKAATNWSAYADQLRALEDYTVDGTVTGALDENKI